MCALILLGPPGSGKTTLARGLAERAPITIIEVGNLLRSAAETPAGQHLQSFTAAGKLVPTNVVIQVISQELHRHSCPLVVFDGIPRSLDQVDPFLNLLQENRLSVCAIILLTLDLDTILLRISARRICSQCGLVYNLSDSSLPSPLEGQPVRVVNAESACPRCGGKLIQRPDDREDIVRRRFHQFQRETIPAIEILKDRFPSRIIERSAALPKADVVQQLWSTLEPLLQPSNPAGSSVAPPCE